MIFACLPCIFLFSPLTESFQIYLQHISFFTVLFPIVLFPTELPKSSSCFDHPAGQTTQRKHRKAALLLPTCAVLITFLAHTSADWFLLKSKQTHLPCCREWERESCCDPRTDRVISEDWLTRVCLLKEAEDALSLCFSLFGCFPGSTLIPVSGTISVLVSKVCFCLLGS